MTTTKDHVLAAAPLNTVTPVVTAAEGNSVPKRNEVKQTPSEATKASTATKARANAFQCSAAGGVPTGSGAVSLREQELQQQLAQMSQMMERMQERLAWLELSQSESGHYIDDLLMRVDKLERQVKYLAMMQEAPAAVRPLSEETPPPHY